MSLFVHVEMKGINKHAYIHVYANTLSICPVKMCVHMYAYKSKHTINVRSSPDSCSFENYCRVISHSLGIPLQPFLQEDGAIIL